MAKRTYTQKDGTIWEWEETKETQKALKEYLSVSSGKYLYTPPSQINKD